MYPFITITGSTSNPVPPLPVKVRALYNSQMKEMTETSRGQWTPVTWQYNYALFDATNYNSSRNHFSAAYQLILEFKDTNFLEGERHVLTHLSNLLDTQTLSDVTFVVKNEKIGAHSAIVVSASPVLSAMLEEDKIKEGRTKIVKIDDIDPAIFKEVLRYLYTGRAPKLDEDEMTEPLFLAADKYQIKGLKDLCEQNLIKKLNMQTVFNFLVVSYLHSAPHLLEASLKFLVSHKREVWPRSEWKELNKSFPDLFFSASRRMSLNIV